MTNRPTVVADVQRAFEEEELDDERLLALLEDRETLKEELKPKRKAFKAADDSVKQLLEQLELGQDVSYRIGKFTVRISEAEEKHIEFERSSSLRFSIRADKKRGK